MGYFSMPKYFQNMPTVGKALVNPNAENETEIKEIEKQIHDKVTEVKRAWPVIRNAAYQRSCR